MAELLDQFLHEGGQLAKTSDGKLLAKVHFCHMLEDDIGFESMWVKMDAVDSQVGRLDNQSIFKEWMDVGCLVHVENDNGILRGGIAFEMGD